MISLNELLSDLEELKDSDTNLCLHLGHHGA
jgi:hypothetical protein